MSGRHCKVGKAGADKDAELPEGEEDEEQGRSSTDKLRGSGVDEKALEDVGTGKGKEIVVQTRAKDDERSGEFAMKEGIGEEDIGIILLTRKAINSHQLALEIIQRQMRESGASGVKRLLPAAAKFLKAHGTEEVIVVSAGEIFEEMCDEELWDRATAESWLLPLASHFLLDPKQGFDVHVAWSLVVTKMLPVLSYEKKRKEVLTLVLEGGAHPTKDSIRLGCGRITAALFSHLQLAHATEVPDAFQTRPKKEKMGLFDRAMALCQDTDHRVRTSMADQLEKFVRIIKSKGEAKEIGSMVVAITEELEELLRDERTDVRDVACRAAVALIPLVDEKSAGKLMALVQNDLYGRANDRPRDAVYLSQHLAPLLHVKGGEPEVDAASWDFFYPFFKDAPDNPNVDIRCHVAFNMPGLLHAGGTSRYPKMISPISNALLADEESSVRTQMAKSMVGMARGMGSQFASVHLIPPFTVLLKDKDPNVSRAVAERLGQLIPLLCPTTIPDPAAAERVATAVCKFLGPMQGNHVFWRQELAVCQGLGQAIGCFPALCVQLTVLPGLMGSLESSPRVAIAAADALLGYLRECRKPEVRAEVLSKIAREFSRGLEYSRRLLFANMCFIVCHHFSRQFFRILFADPILEIVRDPVPMVRCRAAALLPILRGCLRLPTMDHTLQERIMTAVSLLINDKDKLVREAASMAQKEIMNMGSSAVQDPGSVEKLKDEEEVHGAPLDRKLAALSMLGSPMNLVPRSTSSASLDKQKKAVTGSTASKIAAVGKSTSHGRLHAPAGKNASAAAPSKMGSISRTTSAPGLPPKHVAASGISRPAATAAPHAGVQKKMVATGGVKPPLSGGAKKP